MPSAVEILNHHGAATVAYLEKAISARPGVPARLLEALRYSILAGGKRLRPTLVLECWAACRRANGRSIDPVDRSALACAGAMELIHTFSLVHDDLPAMDDDDLRRGQPTNHKVFGEAMAILAGDAMTTLAFEIIAGDARAELVPGLVRELASASGPEGMIGGQALDILSENQPVSLEQLQQIHRMKTGALLIASCRMGAIAAGASEAQLGAVTNYGKHLGLAFQIVDDLLDVTSTPQQLGKATKKDVTKGKNTYPALLGIERAQQQAQQEFTAALASLDPLAESAENLRALAEFVVDRTV